ncbi:restin homolog [Eurosta solidaginis]|uniref:restin homolog n=1 Tax=Eurosta solidaginis TaxID=178769 RepID=UPI0035309414
MANAEMDMKANLTDLTKIPAKEFEKHFRDWMDRDDVARALQAKLRTDLISNFNKTALGRQILAQTSTTTGGGSTQRLTLSPLVLALNTLVAEFLYAQNCHFSLSVFCTEVPFRNTLPDFESAQHFRFTVDEIKEILEAIFGKSSNDSAFSSSIINKYECNTNVSLLLLLLRHLLKQKEEFMKKMASIKSGFVTEGTQTTPINGEVSNTEKFLSPARSHEIRRSKTEIPSGNIKYLNKYLLMLSNKVKEMSAEFESLRSKGLIMPTTKISKSVRTRRYEKLNRSLERIMEQLKHMTHTKRKRRQVGAVVSAIDLLATQFSKCVESFKSVSRDIISSNQRQERKPLNAPAEVQVDLSYRRATAGEQKESVEEKTYIDWVHEMRHTKNGQKFLDRIESSLKKALNKQRELLRKESEEKLRHQKELLRIQYKEKLVEHITKLPAYDFSREAHKINESIGHQLEEFEIRHSELLQRIQDVHKVGVSKVSIPSVNGETEIVSDVNAQTETTEAIVRRVVKEMDSRSSPTEAHPSARTKDMPFCDNKPRDPILKDVVNTQKQLQKMVESISKQERNVDQIVYEARMRIQELENESNQLEMNFRNYLERQRIQADTMREVVSSLSENHTKPSPTVGIYHHKVLKSIQKPFALKNGKEKRNKKLKQPNKPAVELMDDNVNGLTDQENKSPNLEYRNAILDAKTKFFQEQRTSQQTEINEDEVCFSRIEPFYYNRNFGRIQSHINLLSSDVSSCHLNEEVTSLAVHPSPMTTTSVSRVHLTTAALEQNNAYANPLSARSHGAPLAKRYTMLPSTPQIIPTKSSLKREPHKASNKQKSAAAKPIDEQKNVITQSLPKPAPKSDVTAPTLIVQTTNKLPATVAVVANGNDVCRNGADEQTKRMLLQDVDSEISISSNDDADILDKQENADNQSICDYSENTSSSSSSIGSENHVAVNEDNTERSAQMKDKIMAMHSGGNGKTKDDAGFEDVFSAKTVIKMNPQCNTTLRETMERMHKLFTETPKTGVARGKWTQAKAKKGYKHIAKEKTKSPQNGKQKSPTVKKNRQQKDTTHDTEFLNSEKVSTSAKCLINANAGKNVKQRKEEATPYPSKTQKQTEQTAQSLNYFLKTEFETHASTEKVTTSATIQQYNITVAPNSTPKLEKLPTTISSTTFSVHLDDNLKEIVSESSLEIAGMVEAVDEEIELDELVAESDEEEEDEEEAEEEFEPMGSDGKQQAIVQFPVIEEVSAASSTTSSALRMSTSGGGGGGGGLAADSARHSVSGSDFWE